MHAVPINLALNFKPWGFFESICSIFWDGTIRSHKGILQNLSKTQRMTWNDSHSTSGSNSELSRSNCFQFAFQYRLPSRTCQRFTPREATGATGWPCLLEERKTRQNGRSPNLVGLSDVFVSASVQLKHVLPLARWANPELRGVQKNQARWESPSVRP